MSKLTAPVIIAAANKLYDEGKPVNVRNMYEEIREELGWPEYHPSSKEREELKELSAIVLRDEGWK